jgi:hypothetical protein
MNPPFVGYGGLQPEVRSSVAAELRLRGRFNLSHAFVKKAIQYFRPEILVSLLPSNWFYSRRSYFFDELNQEGAWDWTDVGDDAFDGINAHVGILIWRNSIEKKRKRSMTHQNPSASQLDVRHGVATGRDEAFKRLARVKLPFGKTVLSVAGRDIDKAGKRVWIPPKRLLLKKEAITLLASMPHDLRTSLSQRSCVTGGRREIYQYHESVSGWFLKEPKILVPEIVSGKLKVEFDATGKRLPLHSVIAIRIPSLAIGRELCKHLRSDAERNNFLRTCPRLSGGAFRLNVGAVRRSIHRWKLRLARGS